MADISPVDAVGGGAAAPDPGTDADADAAALQDAFAQGVVNFMGIMLQGVEGDTIDSINDTTSNPDAPS